MYHRSAGAKPPAQRLQLGDAPVYTRAPLSATFLGRAAIAAGRCLILARVVSISAQTRSRRRYHRVNPSSTATWRSLAEKRLTEPGHSSGGHSRRKTPAPGHSRFLAFISTVPKIRIRWRRIRAHKTPRHRSCNCRFVLHNSAGRSGASDEA
jgi:hypothetical protein